MNTANELEEIRAEIRRLDEMVDRLRTELPDGDARDHLLQIHFLLTFCKGHLGAVSYGLKELSREKRWCPICEQNVLADGAGNCPSPGCGGTYPARGI